MIRKIVSGGQTGADRAALDAAILAGYPHGGWAPKGKLAEDGPLPSPPYSGMMETESDEPRVRTELNVRDADATLVVTHGQPVGGTAFTVEVCKRLGKPLLHVDLTTQPLESAVRSVRAWVDTTRCSVLNVAGPRASEDANVYEPTKAIVLATLLAGHEPAAATDILSIVLELRKETGANFRHWDQIRWLVPYWFCVLSAATVAVLISTDASATVVQFCALALAAFGAACFVLLINLGKYTSRTIGAFDDVVSTYVSTPGLQQQVKYNLPFSLSRPGLFRTATFWFGSYMVLIVLLCIYTAWKGPWW